ncbi:MAG TPA: hypothetical protein PK970_10865 [Hyphomicrobiaceae bacterium]|nr:hypothetical protein [Hyphomicrobiaceae bacterium]
MLLKYLFSALALVFAVSVPAAAAPCHPSALEMLRRNAPEAFAVHQKIADKAFFMRWITCDDVQLGLTTAVHESVHALTSQLNAYPLIDGRTVPRVADSRAFFPPRRVAGAFRDDSTYVQNYLQEGGATSAVEFGFLLDELNAYSHDLNTAVRLRSMSTPDRHVYHRDGLAALMSFVAAYVERARLEGTETWRTLQVPVIRKTVTTLWAQSESVMGASCRTPNYGDETPSYLASICSATIGHGLGQVLGRPPLCPVSCLSVSGARLSARQRASARTQTP